VPSERGAGRLTVEVALLGELALADGPVVEVLAPAQVLGPCVGVRCLRTDAGHVRSLAQEVRNEGELPLVVRLRGLLLRLVRLMLPLLLLQHDGGRLLVPHLPTEPPTDSRHAALL
jgi:hypothetical protein